MNEQRRTDVEKSDVSLACSTPTKKQKERVFDDVEAAEEANVALLMKTALQWHCRIQEQEQLR